MNPKTGAYYEGEEVEKAKKRGEPLIELPYKPTPDCPKCRGRGTVRSWLTAFKYGACPVCYPDHKHRAKSFKERLHQLSRIGPDNRR
jgi:hypothetical protein